MEDIKVAIVIPPKNFRDETLSTLDLLLAKKDIKKEVSGFTSKDCVGFHGAVVKPDSKILSLDPVSTSALILADGPGVDSLKLYDYRPLLDIVKSFHDNKKVIVGIGNGIKIVARANIVRDTKIASNDKDVEKLVSLYRGLAVTNNYLVRDKSIITLSDPNKIDELVTLLSEELGSF